MSTLKEIKGRIASVKNTLKITSAMKLVASAKLRRAQQAIEAMRPYQQQLQRMLDMVTLPSTESDDYSVAKMKSDAPEQSSTSRPKAIIALASNSSLCGGFNANVIAKVRSVRQKGDVVYSIGRKMADAMRRDGFPSPEDFSALSDHPAYGPVADLVERLTREVEAGQLSAVFLVYNHFVSTARQEPVVETLLGSAGTTADTPAAGEGAFPFAKKTADASGNVPSPAETTAIMEPSREELLAALLPKTRKLKLYAALLDSAAAEHAARTVAMQTATDNAENLLSELTLQYNKGRQQKITSEILDLAGGQAESK